MGRGARLPNVANNFYSFRSVWHLPGAPDDAYRVLARLVDYPSWWPEVKEVRARSADECELRVRSVLPYDLRFVSRQTRQDPEQRVLEASMNGDLNGFSRWTIEHAQGGTRAAFDEEVEAEKELLRKLAPIARPAFRVNHTVMMRHGERGLREGAFDRESDILNSKMPVSVLNEAEYERAEGIIADGLLMPRSDRLVLTDRGRLLADAVVRMLID